MIIEGEDGITHINIYSKAKTILGQFLSNFFSAPIKIPEHGEFNSIEGYWYWLITRDNRLKELHGYEAKQLGRELTVFDLFSTKRFLEENSEEFKNCIKQAIHIKLDSYFVFIRELQDSTLPFCHYYEYSGKRVDAGYEWIVEYIEEIRSNLKKNNGL